MSRTGRGRGRARAEIAVVRVLEKRLGALPVVAEFGRRLRIAEIVDELCPVRPVAWISHGEVIEALVANRLTAPAPMVRVQEWAAAMAVDEAYGISPVLLNDDRIARALDAIGPQLDAITGGVGAAAITEFGVDVSRLHWDLTSISLYGAYPAADAEYPAPRWGYPKDRRADLRQVQTGLAVSGDGGIPVFHRAYSGGAAEVAQVTGAMTALKQIAGPRPFLLVGDSKLISYTNAAAMTAQGVGFVAPLGAARVPAGLFAALPAGAGTAVDYAAGRDAGKPAAARGSYRVLDDGGMDLPGPRKADPPVHPRRGLRAHHHHLRHHRQACAVLALRPGRDRRVGRGRRLVRPADQPDAQPGQPRRSLPPLQGPARRRTPLWRVQRPPRGRAPVPEDQPPHRRFDHGDLPGPADLLPDRTAGPQRPAPPRREDDRPARLPAHPGQAHRQNHLPGPRRPAPDPPPRRQPRPDPQTHRRPGPPTGPPQGRHQPAPLANPVKPHVRRPWLVAKLPKGGRTRTVPLPHGVAALVQAYAAVHPPQPYTLPRM